MIHLRKSVKIFHIIEGLYNERVKCVLIKHVHRDLLKSNTRRWLTAYSEPLNTAERRNVHSLLVYFVSCGGRGTPASLMLETCSFYDITACVLFNCGEDVFSRSKQQNKMLYVQNTFVTHYSWKNLGGIIPLLKMKCATRKLRSMVLHGPPMKAQSFQLSDDFRSLRCGVRSLPEHTYYEDENLWIGFLPLLADTGNQNLLNTEKLIGCSVAFLIRIRDDVSTKTGFPLILVLEIPDHSYLDSLLLSEELKEYCPSIGIVVHLSPQSVLDDERFGRFMKRFGNDTFHFVMNETCDCKASVQSEYLSTYLDDTIFLPPSSPPRRNQDRVQPSPGQFFKAIPDTCLTIRHNSTSLSYLDDDETSYKYPDKKTEEKARKDSRKLKKALETMRKSGDVQDKNYPVIHFLGTGSSAVTPCRGQSGIYLQISEDSAVLMDCGEGVLNQLKETYGNKVDKMLAKIEFVFISHLHSDHFISVFAVLEARYHALQRLGRKPTPVVTLGPNALATKMLHYLEFWSSCSDITLLVSNKEYALNRMNLQSQSCMDLNLRTLKPVKVIHTKDSFGLVIQHNDGWKVVYSGDAIPSQNLILYGRECDLLIHEATFPDSMLKEAKRFQHSTVSQAIDTGKKMKAKNIILTHFGYTQSPVPHITDEMLHSNNVGVAFDNMRVTLKDLPYLHLTLPVLKTLNKNIELDI